MRRLVACGVVVMLAVGLSAPASGATLLRVAYAVVDTTKHPVVGIESDLAVQRIETRFRIAGSQQVVATRDDFRHLGTQGRISSWAADTVLSLDLGVYEIDVDIWNVDGEHATRINAGKYDTRIRTWFADFSVTPTSVDYDMQDVTFRGRLLSGTPGEDERPMAGVQVDAFANSAQTTTAADGSFTMTGSVGGIYVAARYDGDPTHRPVESAHVAIEHVAQPTRLSLVAPTSAVKGAKTTVTGLLERQRAGTWVPLPAETVAIAFHHPDNSWNWLTSVRTDAQGRYSATVTLPETGMLRAELMGWWALQPANVYTNQITVRTKTSFSSFDAAPEPVGKGSALTITGNLGVAGQRVSFYFRRYGATTWTHKGWATTDQSGAFRSSYGADVDGTWEARYAGDATHLSTTASDYVDVKYRTSLSSFNAAPEPVAKGKTLTVSGKLNRYVSAWGPLGGKTVYIYFRPYGATAWSYMGVATSDRYGKWRKGFKAARDGTWYARYKGSDTYLPVTSGGDYVDVR